MADCVPVYLVAPEAIALVHAGREGTARGITGGAVRQLSRRYGVAPASISALIGPSAGPCCYQVSADLREAWVEKGLVARGDHLDLWETNRRQLLDAHVNPAKVQIVPHCTICQPGFFSYRAQKTKNRNLGLLMR